MGNFGICLATPLVDDDTFQSLIFHVLLHSDFILVC
jgi:hypothetical protein